MAAKIMETMSSPVQCVADTIAEMFTYVDLGDESIPNEFSGLAERTLNIEEFLEVIEQIEESGGHDE
jgi:hypothetical protein